jgi:hypothetical protein
MQPGEMNIDPIESEFFSTEALDSLADAFVREAIQNSLDARVANQLRVRIASSTPKTQLSGDSQARYLSGLWEHVTSGKSGVSELPKRAEPLSYLVIEDFGTRGLQGDPKQSEDDESESGPRNDFCFFWRNIGRSKKSATDLGRWGLGKTVFPRARV